MNPARIQLSRKRGWKMPGNTVKVDRSTPWGNPFVPDAPPGFLTLPACLVKFEELARTWSLEPLRGKNLACWCPLTSPCHADILLRLANVAQLRILANDGVTFFEGDDYTTDEWKPGRYITFHRLAYRILRNEAAAGLRVVTVSCRGELPRSGKEVPA